MKKIAIAVALLVSLTGVVHAAGDAEAGKSKAVTCIACHGADGNSIAPNYPNLAGQHESFLYKQLKDFKEGKRKDPTMNAMVMALDDQAMKDISAFFSKQTLKPGKADPEWVDEGEAIYKGGIAEIGAPACMGCHGPMGEGIPGSGFPLLASQKAEYTEKALKDFRAAAQNMGDTPVGRANDINRIWTNDVNKMMRNAVKRLNDQEIKAVAQYIQGLQP